MYDISTKAVNKLDGELSTKFVNVAEENAEAEEDISTTAVVETITEVIDRSDSNVSESEENEDRVPAGTSIVKTVVKYDEKEQHSEDNKVLISSGYSVIKSE
jgi:hypothetical protein